uniref:Glutaredoxin domain-containing protein n=1 Tax=Plectus sambesii TaxID=2011161 RepID=A0A914UWY6_9BILA
MGGRSTKSAEEMASAKEFVDKMVNGKKVVVFSKSYCPYCHKAKSALQSFKLPAEVLEWIELDERGDLDGDAIQDYLLSVTGGRSVPRVFIGGKFFGGGDDTAAARKNGTLEKLLKDTGAL